MNDFLREITGIELTARTFRTWGATTHLAQRWAVRCKEDAELAPHARMLACIADVARRLGNTPSVCRNSYLDPRVVSALESGSWETLVESSMRIRGLSAEESAVLALLKDKSPRRRGVAKRAD